MFSVEKKSLSQRTAHTDSALLVAETNERTCCRPAKNWQIIHKKHFGITHKTVTIIAIQLAELRSTESVFFFWKFQCWHGWMGIFSFFFFDIQTTKQLDHHSTYFYSDSLSLSLFHSFWCVCFSLELDWTLEFISLANSRRGIYVPSWKFVTKLYVITTSTLRDTFFPLESQSQVVGHRVCSALNNDSSAESNRIASLDVPWGWISQRIQCVHCYCCCRWRWCCCCCRGYCTFFPCDIFIPRYATMADLSSRFVRSCVCVWVYVSISEFRMKFERMHVYECTACRCMFVRVAWDRFMDL